MSVKIIESMDNVIPADSLRPGQIAVVAVSSKEWSALVGVAVQRTHSGLAVIGGGDYWSPIPEFIHVRVLPNGTHLQVGANG